MTASPSMTHYGVRNPFEATRGDFMRICFCDAAGNRRDLPYGHSFLEGFESKHCYDRFWNPPEEQGESRSEYVQRRTGELLWTRYLCCGYNFATVTRSTGFGEVILDHFRHHYFQMGVLAHFHRASLLKYSRRLTVAAAAVRKQLKGKEWKALMFVRREFAEFINQYWFREISNQEQARELFSWWSGLLGNGALLQQLTQEAVAVDRIVQQLDEVHRRKVQAKHQKRLKKLQKSTDDLTKVILYLAGLTLVVAFLDAEWMRTFLSRGWSWFIQGQWNTRDPLWAALAKGSAAGLALGGAGLLVIRHFMKKRRDDAAESRSDKH